MKIESVGVDDVCEATEVEDRGVTEVEATVIEDRRATMVEATEIEDRGGDGGKGDVDRRTTEVIEDIDVDRGTTEVEESLWRCMVSQGIWYWSR